MKNKYFYSIIIFLVLISSFGIYKYLTYDYEHHVHADFLVTINGEKINFSQSKYQSTSTNSLHENVHLHDGKGDVIHYHERNISLQEFFVSLDMNITNNCFETQNDSYCQNETHSFEVYVNNQTIDNPQNYVANDLDQIAIIYQNKNLEIDNILENVTDKACIQSAICPSRGSPSEGSCVTGESCAVDISDVE